MNNIDQEEIAALRQQNAALRAELEQLKSLHDDQRPLLMAFDVLPIIMYELDATGTYKRVHGAGLARIGLTADRVLGRTVYDVARDVPELLADVDQIYSTGQPFVGSYKYRDFTLQIHAIPMKDETGKVTGVQGILHDVTDLVQAQAEVQIRERRFQSVLSNAVHTLVAVSETGEILFATSPVDAQEGIDLSPHTGVNLFDRRIWLENQTAYNRLRDLFDEAVSGQIARGDIIIDRQRFGKKLVMDVIIKPIDDEEIFGQKAYIIEAHDITDSYDYYNRLIESQNFIARVLDAAPYVTYVYDYDEENTVFVNPAIKKLLGVTQEEFLSSDKHNATRFIHPDDLDLYFAELDAIRSMADGEVRDSIYRFVLKNGAVRYLQMRRTPLIRRADRTVKQVVGIVQDITESRETSARLMYSENLLRKVFDDNLQLMLLLSPEGHVEQINGTMQRYFGLEPEQVIGHLLWDSYDFRRQHIVDDMRVAVMKAARGELARLQFNQPDVNNNMVELDMSITPLRDDHGEIFKLLVEARDITQIESLRRELAHEQEVNVLKTQFVSMVSHEFRTPLSIILSSAQVLQRHLDRLPSGRRDYLLNKISWQVNHMTHMLNDVLIMGRFEADKIDFSPEWFDFDAFCRDYLQTLRETSDAHERVQYTCEIEGSTAIFADTHLMTQVVDNLVSNALKYSPDDQDVIVRLSRESDAGRFVMTVRDYGIGIPPEDMPHVFDNFRRAGNVGNVPGSGLGLTIVERAVKHHGGTVICESQPDEGTTFIVTLPASQPNAPA